MIAVNSIESVVDQAEMSEINSFVVKGGRLYEINHVIQLVESCIIRKYTCSTRKTITNLRMVL